MKKYKETVFQTTDKFGSLSVMTVVFELFADKNPCSQRQPAGNVYNQAMLNYVPALTKQYDYNLTKIHVYAAKPNFSFKPIHNKAGETCRFVLQCA